MVRLWRVRANHTVTFNSNGGTGTMSTQVANVPTALTANAFTRTGYTFSGWNTAAGGTGTAYANGATYSFAADITLYAQWTALREPHGDLQRNGGTGTMSAQIANVPTALTANTFTRTGYTFSGWNTAANGAGTAYANGATYSFAADITLYAQWTALREPHGDLQRNGGTGTMSAQVANVPTALTANTFTRTGYTFSGWNTAAGGAGTAYADGATYSFAADITLYAQWTALREPHGDLQQQRRHGHDECPDRQRADGLDGQHLHADGLHVQRLEHGCRRHGHRLRQRRDLLLRGRHHAVCPVDGAAEPHGDLQRQRRHGHDEYRRSPTSRRP